MTERVRPEQRRLPTVAAYLLTAAIAAGLAGSVYRIPIQVSDSLEVMVRAAEAASAWELFAAGLRDVEMTVRPLRHVQARWLIDVADATGLSYHATFRGVHALLAVTALFLFTACVRPRTWLDLAAFAPALTVFAGLHTFAAILREAYPVNHFAQGAVAALAVVAVARSAPRWWAQLVLLAAFAFALLLIESAALIAVVMVGATLLRLPGIRPWAAAAALLMLVAYAGGRAAYDVQTPGIGAHGSGYGGRFYSGDELQARFGDRPLPFMAYNVGSAVLSVLASEPRFGVYQLATVRAPRGVSPVTPINIVSSLGVTAIIAWYALVMLRRGWRTWDEHDRLIALFAVVLLANAALCAAYIKDEVLSTAGAFYAIAAFVSVRGLLAMVPARGRAGAVMALATVVLAVTAPLWAFRAVGTHFELRRSAFSLRNDWVSVLSPVTRDAWPDDEKQIAFIRRIKNDVLFRRVASPAFLPKWGDRYWVE